MIANLPALFDAANRRSPREWMVRCPAHGDRTPSLSIKRGADRWLLHCHAGCETSDVLRALGLEWQALMSPSPGWAGRETRLSCLPEPAPRRPYPGADEVRGLWDACESVDDPRDEAMYAAEWLYVERGIHPAVVARRDLARVLTRRTPLPRWARYGEASWYATGHRLILPAFDHEGVMRGVRARGVLGSEKKELAPQGVRSSGLVFADAGGRHLLEHGIGLGAARVVICEGAPDFLTWASTRDESEAAHPATLGITSGAWTAQIAARIPDGACVLIDTDDDGAGRRYARDVARSLAGRCELRQRAPSRRVSA